MSEQPQHYDGRGPAALTLPELAAQQHASVIDDVSALAVDLWASDEEVEAFQRDVRASRRASMT